MNCSRHTKANGAGNRANVRRPVVMVFVTVCLGSLPVLLLGAQGAEGAERTGRPYAEYFRVETAKLAGACLADLGRPEQWLARREGYRRELLDMLGLWPMPKRTELRATVTGRTDHGDFGVERLHYQSMPGLYVTADLYLPKALKEPAPAILYVCGHGPTIRDGVSYGNKVSYHHHGVWYARHGYVCLIIDTLQLGEIEGVHHGTYRMDQWWWNSRGYTPAGVETWNSIRAIDYLETRAEVDANRIGMTGRSGGGAYTWFVSAVDDRVRVAAPVAGITDLENHVVDGTVEGHCDCMYFVNSYRWDYPQLAALLAPRPLLIANSDKDPIFPLSGVVRVHSKVKTVYGLLGATANLGLLITEGPHQDTQDLQLPVFRWFNRFLKSQDPVIEEAAVKLLAAEQLKVFGELPADAVNAEIQETFVAPAPPAPVPGSVGEWRERKREWLAELEEKTFGGWPSDARPVAPRAGFDVGRYGVRLRAFDFASQPGVELRVYVAQREGLREPRGLEVWVLDEEDWEVWLRGMRFAFASELDGEGGREPQATAMAQDQLLAPADPAWFDQLRERLSAAPVVVAWMAPRGVGPAALKGGGDQQSIQIRRRFMLLGQTLDGMRVWDIRRGLEVLRSLGMSESLPIQLRGGGRMGVNVLLAAAFEPGIETLEVADLTATFRDGPDYLGILKVLDVPQVVALVADHARVVLVQPRPGDWGFVAGLADRLGWGAGRVEIATGR